MKSLALVAAILFSVQFRSAAAVTNGLELRQLVQQYLPGCTVQPNAPSRPLAISAASGNGVALAAAMREKAETKKGIGYWVTPTMAFLGRQKIDLGGTNDPAGVIQLLHTIWRGPDFVKQRTYTAIAVEGGWVVEVGRTATNNPVIVPDMQPYELVLDATQHVVEIRERAYPYSGSAANYGGILRSVYEREMHLNGAANYAKAVEEELARATERERLQKAAEKLQKAAKPPPAEKKQP